MEVLAILALLGVGIAAGILSGLLGVGGGILLTPFLHYGLKMPWLDAVALSLFVIAVQAPVGIWQHRRRQAVSWRLGAWMSLGGIVGVLAGNAAAPHLSVVVLKFAFAALLGLAALRMTGPVVAYQERLDAAPVVVLLGVGAGFVSRLLGVGGGILTVPVLTFLGVPVHLAVGSSLVPVFANAAAASGINLAGGLDWTGGLVLAAAAIGGTVAGVRLAHRLPEQGLRGVVGTAMAVAAFLMAFETSSNGL